ncbi:kinase domain-containing [Cryptosporidium sp. chipmunk genotype I]|uniref:kinase domain-containing n=1 Tax=Cryptosporidium sp. chipmunk genotype I TaxID=1280935 RepID=UPI003519E874|nr:kinase domain-containing [Cryptosporidium sp. chipmunk genotype I]
MIDSNQQQNGLPSTFLGQSGVGYKICDRLGAGSASVVFRCKSVGRVREDGIMVPIDEEYFAVKIIDMKSIYLTPDFRDKKNKLLEEAMILHKLRHPNIVSLVDFSDSGDTFYLVMDLVQGGELFYKIVECGSLSESSARFILKQVVEALMYMHQKEIIHRDLKPENILIDRSYPGEYFIIKVADFGVAKFLRQGYTQARTLVGTPQYWAPEVLSATNNGVPYGTEADLWSLGVLFYVMLGGAFPFDERKGNLERLIREGNYHFRYPRFKRVSEQAKQLIRRLLTVDPTQRMTLFELKQDPWMNIKCENEPSIVEIQDNIHSPLPERHEIVLFKSMEDADNATFNKAITKKEPVNIIGKAEAGQGFSVQNGPIGSSKTSSIMDINGLLDLQLSVAYKLHGIYIAFRHNSTICRVIQQHIHKWRILQQRSYVAIGKFKQTCESVLDELPDFLLAVNTNEPKLAIELLSHVKSLVDVTQNDVEDIQSSYNNFLFELSNFVESVRDIKRITETSVKTIPYEVSREFGVEGMGETEVKDQSSLTGGSVSMNSDKSKDGLYESRARSDFDSSTMDISSNCLNTNEGGSFSRSGSNAMSNSNGSGNVIRSEFDPSIFIGYNSARDRVIRKITDLFLNSEINALFDHLESEDPNSKMMDTGEQGKVTGGGTVDEFPIGGLSSDLSIQVHGKSQFTQNSSYITTSLASTRDLLLDFLFLPASICNVPPTGVESLIQEGVDFDLPILSNLEITAEKLNSLGKDYEVGGGGGSSGGGSVEDMLNASMYRIDGIHANSNGSEFSSKSGAKKTNSTERLDSVMVTEESKSGVENKLEDEVVGSGSGGFDYFTEKGGFTIPGSNSSTIYEQSVVKRRSENQLKISYILVRVLAQLRMIESILGRCVAFWGNMNIMIEKILQLRQHAERLLGFTGNPVLRTRFDERVESYREFWQELRDICDSYLRSSQIRQLSLENQVHELLDTASKVDTVFNMNIK